MRGDTSDIVGRLRSVLPTRWFSDRSPNLDAILACLATPWSWLYGFICYVIQQSRLNTATGQWLDLIAYDFMGSVLLRRPGEDDLAYRGRIAWALVREAATRAAVIANLRRLTGNNPRLFEPANCSDTGGYGCSMADGTIQCLGMVYGMAGGWGSLNLPFQFFVTAKLPVIEVLSSLAGYCTGAGGYGIGSVAYADIASSPGSLTNTDVEAAIVQCLPICTTAWLHIS